MSTDPRVQPPSSPAWQPLAGATILSLAPNLPGPAALMRCRMLGARCIKVDPPGGDPMRGYAPAAFADLHEGVERLTLDLKEDEGLASLHALLARTDVLLTSSRPSALRRLGLDWPALHARHARLSMVAIVGGAGEAAEIPGHDLTYLAEAGLLAGDGLPPTLFVDMAGALAAAEAVLQVMLHRHTTGQSARREVALAGAADWLAMPRRWGLTLPTGPIGGALASYGVYRCRDGRVAVAALEPHFARRLANAAGWDGSDFASPAARAAIGRWLAGLDCIQVRAAAEANDLPLHAMADAA